MSRKISSIKMLALAVAFFMLSLSPCVNKGADISHSGGSIVEYILYDVTTGTSKASNPITLYKDYI